MCADPCWDAYFAGLAHRCPAQPALWRPTRSHAVQTPRPAAQPRPTAPRAGPGRGPREGCPPRPSRRLDFQVKSAVGSVVTHASPRPSCAPAGTPARLSPAPARPDGQEVPQGPAGGMRSTGLAARRNPAEPPPQRPARRLGDGGQRVERHGAAVLPPAPVRLAHVPRGRRSVPPEPHPQHPARRRCGGRSADDGSRRLAGLLRWLPRFASNWSDTWRVDRSVIRLAGFQVSPTKKPRRRCGDCVSDRSRSESI